MLLLCPCPLYTAYLDSQKRDLNRVSCTQYATCLKLTENDCSLTWTTPLRGTIFVMLTKGRTTQVLYWWEASWSMDKQPQDYLPRRALKFTGTFQTINSSAVKLICKHGGGGDDGDLIPQNTGLGHGHSCLGWAWFAAPLACASPPASFSASGDNSSALPQGLCEDRYIKRQGDTRYYNDTGEMGMKVWRGWTTCPKIKHYILWLN